MPSDLNKDDSGKITPWNQSFYLTRKSWVTKEENRTQREISEDKIKIRRKKMLRTKEKLAASEYPKPKYI